MRNCGCGSHDALVLRLVCERTLLGGLNSLLN
ncbi:hypothetical protein RSOL_106580 [Rhizoctonia solani AG-3 Rhs1AP]|uniref:Uncharacterized protein n=1 Tax=Rhizoctonia solani AG-3 Rhs1AP TaxID=1086054 RepID=X8J012_9AGAM|nr:hypothetical protein RSOL_106580 [Rhizoctonia solani AG-3 Rhs1AP]